LFGHRHEKENKGTFERKKKHGIHPGGVSRRVVRVTQATRGKDSKKFPGGKERRGKGRKKKKGIPGIGKARPSITEKIDGREKKKKGSNSPLE